MDTVSPARPKVSFPAYLSGGGEMGELIHNFDWRKSPLGALEKWPQSLRTTVSICLNSKFPILIWWGKDHVKIYNDAYSVIISTKHPNALGAKGEAVWPEIWHIIGPMLKSVVEEGKATWSENLLLLLHRKGFAEECYFTFSYSPIRDESGAVGGVFSAITETTEAVTGERQLKTLQDLAQKISEARDERDVYDKAAEVIAQNPKDFPFFMLHQLSDEGTFLHMPAADASASDEEAHIREAITTHRPVVKDNRGNEARLACGPWKIPASKILALPVTTGNQKTPYAVLEIGVNPHRLLDEKYTSFYKLVVHHIATGISNARTLEEERKKAEALEQIDKAKTAFFSNISHEFRTPITLMLGPLEELLEKGTNLSDHERQSLETTHRNGLRLLKLVNTLLDFSRIESGRYQASFSPVDLGIYTGNLASNFRSLIEKAGLQFIYTTSPTSDPVYVDKQMWEKIVFNLLSNAFKYTLKGSITISLTSADHHAELCVTDTGVGIPEEELPNMFERFHRVKNSVARTYEGSGIGLSLVREFVKLHSGTISVDSKTGQGTSFRVRIPLGKDHLPPALISEVDEHTSAIPGGYLEEAASLLRRPEPVSNNGGAIHKHATVLVVDDNADMRFHLQRLLQEEFRVVLASDGREALDKIKTEQPALVLSDIMMPVMDGLELLKELRNSSETSGIPIILITARAGEESRIEGYDSGADDYLVKPFSSKELLARIRSQLNIAAIREKARKTLISLVEERTADLKRSNDDLQQFAHVASHDLKEPVRKIQTFTTFLIDDYETHLPEKGKVYLRKIEASINRIYDMIEGVLNYSSLNGQPENNELTDLNKVFERIDADFELMIEQTEATLHYSNLPVVQASHTLVYQLFSNLVGNSLKFTRPGTPAVVTITSAPAETLPADPALLTGKRYVKIMIRDNGIGFDQKFAEKIFSPFTRLNSKDRFEGTGLGLALCKKIVERMHGSISASGVEGEGATFEVLLPVA